MGEWPVRRQNYLNKKYLNKRPAEDDLIDLVEDDWASVPKCYRQATDQRVVQKSAHG